jgi:hypothetical protein
VSQPILSNFITSSCVYDFFDFCDSCDFYSDWINIGLDDSEVSSILFSYYLKLSSNFSSSSFSDSSSSSAISDWLGFKRKADRFLFFFFYH